MHVANLNANDKAWYVSDICIDITTVNSVLVDMLKSMGKKMITILRW